MGNKALITTAMLKTFAEEDHKDYISLLMPFVVELLPKKAGETINILDIAEQMDSRFGFTDIPIGVINKVMQRCTVKYRGNIRKKYKTYELLVSIDDDSFISNKKDIEINIGNVLNKLKGYINSKKLTQINAEEAGKCLMDFLEAHGYRIDSILSTGASSMSPKKDGNIYWVARFIHEESKNPTGIMCQIEAIIEGFLISKALYHFCTDCEKVPRDRLNNTRVFFDTGLLFDSLGYTYDEASKSIKEIMRDVQKYGGKLCTFTHNVDEASRILKICSKDPSKLIDFDLIDLIAKHHNSSQLEFDANRIDELIKRDGFEIIEAEDIDKIMQNRDIPEAVDINWLKAKLVSISEKRHWDHYGEQSIINDAAAIEAITKSRRKSREYNLCNCKAVFITTNPVVIESAKDLMRYLERKEKELGFAISDTDIASILWLKNPRENKKYPSLKLLQNAYSTLRPNRKFMQKYREILSELKGLKEISDLDALEYRSDNDMLSSIQEEVMNDEARLTQETVLRHVQERREETNKNLIDAQKRKDKIDAIDDYNNNLYEELDNERAKNYNLYFNNCLIITRVIMYIACLALGFVSYFGTKSLLGIIPAALLTAIVIALDIDPKIAYAKRISTIIADKAAYAVYIKAKRKLDAILKKPGSPFLNQG